jgi:hypothetical protein
MKCNVPTSGDYEDSLKQSELENDSLRLMIQEKDKRIEELLDSQTKSQSCETDIAKSIDILEKRCQLLEDIISAKDKKIVYLNK